jgi:Zn-finger nucleic acid-binding protein
VLQKINKKTATSRFLQRYISERLKEGEMMAKKCPYCNRQMTSTGRTHEPGVEYECPNCKGVWNYVQTPNFKIISKQGGIIKGTSIFYPVMPPTVLVDIMTQQPNKTQAKRIRQWTKSKRLKHKRR